MIPVVHGKGKTIAEVQAHIARLEKEAETAVLGKYPTKEELKAHADMLRTIVKIRQGTINERR